LDFSAASLDELIRHGLTALRETIQSSSEGLNAKNCSVAIVGEGQKFEIIEGAKLQPYVSSSTSHLSS
jgi:20S proteasome subunit alpha 6